MTTVTSVSDTTKRDGRGTLKVRGLAGDSRGRGAEKTFSQ